MSARRAIRGRLRIWLVSALLVLVVAVTIIIWMTDANAVARIVVLIVLLSVVASLIQTIRHVSRRDS